jgi:four helix bundle protein
MGKRGFLQFLSVARGSLAELETQLTIAQELGFLGQDATLREEIERMFGLLNGPMNSLKH